ncbi:TetR/AcrR family transcriptional regulator [Christensenellaceae bacterium OttesenSCG-928-M15]|nr:TetR/AcrR family transcriptional regulator [Christensenellaceae bacterium OttesenSCG-928-M15]
MEKTLNKRQLQYQHTLEALRAAVDELVNEVGFDNMRVKDITNKAGITEGAFYHYFKSKNDLLFDRYQRSNQQALHAYESELIGMHEIDALKKCIVDGTTGIRIRVLNVMIPFHKVCLEDYLEWTDKEPDGTLLIFERLVESGLKKGTIKPSYSAKDLVDFLQIYINGKTYVQCQRKGAFLNDRFSEQILLDWLESLRA